jgi:hypothetical protein
MDTQIATWEMNLEPAAESITREEIATWPSEPYTTPKIGQNCSCFDLVINIVLCQKLIDTISIFPITSGPMS